MTNQYRSRLPLRSHARRANVMILVTSLLVLLVIIASAFLTRTQAGRQIAGAQQSTAARAQRVDSILDAVVTEVAQSLFPKLIDPADPRLALPVNLADPSDYGYPLVASATFPRKVSVQPSQVRFGIDPIDRLLNGTTDNDVDGDGLPDGYNFAPFHVYPWTNWPDIFADPEVVDPIERPLFAFESNPPGHPGFGDTRWLRSNEPMRSFDSFGEPYFTHWSHLTNPCTSNNGWMLIPDIANCDAGAAWFNTDNDVHPWERNGLFLPYEQWLPGVAPNAAFLVTGQTRGVGTSDGSIGLANQFVQAANGWFGSTQGYLNALGGYSPSGPMPNFLRLAHFGPQREELVPGQARNLVSRRLCDSDGDGFTDSFWFMPPTSNDRSVRYVVGVSVVDNSGMLNANTARLFDRTQTAGRVPTELALMSRRDNVVDGVACDDFNPLRAGFFGQYAKLQDDGSLDLWPGMVVDLWRDQYGAAVRDFYGDAAVDLYGSASLPTFLRELGLVRQFGATGALPASASVPTAFPYHGFEDREVLRMWSAVLDGGRVGVYRDLNFNPIVDEGQVPVGQLSGFGVADEIELRRYSGHNSPVLSRFERSLDPARIGSERDLLRASPARSEIFEGFELPPGVDAPVTVGKLDARQLLHEPRRHLTMFSGARNDQLPPWLWTDPFATGNSLMPARDFSGIYGPDPARQGVADLETARREFLDWNVKLDLRKPMADFQPLATPTNRNVVLRDRNDFIGRAYNLMLRGMLEPESGTSIFGRLDGTTNDIDSQSALELRTARLAASWATNLECWRDGPQKQPGNLVVAPRDDLIHPNESIGVQPVAGGQADRFRFLGNEKQPYILEAFFAVVYPRVRWETARDLAIAREAARQGLSAQEAQELRDRIIQQLPADPNDPFAFPQGLDGSTAPSGGQHFCVHDLNVPETRPAVVLVVQIANPWNAPVDLGHYRLKVGNQIFRFGQNRPAGLDDFDSPSSGDPPYWGYGPAPVLGPCTPEQPRTATVIAMPREFAGNPHFRAQVLDYLDLTHPWLYEDTNRTDGWPWPQSLMLELDAAAVAANNDPANSLFPYPPGFSQSSPEFDLFEDSRTAYPDSLVFNATAAHGTLGLAQGPQSGLTVTDLTAYRKSTLSSDTRSFIELERSVVPILGVPGQNDASSWVVVDRLDRPSGLDGGAVGRAQFSNNQQSFADQVDRLVDPSSTNRLRPPLPQLQLAEGQVVGFSGVELGAEGGGGAGATDDFMVNWVRQTRPWVWDRDGDGRLERSEFAPYFVIARGSPEINRGSLDAFGMPDATGQPDFQRASVDGLSWSVGADPDVSWPTGQFARLPVAGQPLLRGKPTAFTCQSKIDGGERVYTGFVYPTGAGYPEGVYVGDKSAPNVDSASISDEGAVQGGGDDIADLYQDPYPLNFPLQMVQRDGDIESIAELLMVPLWGVVYDAVSPGIAFTVPELMAISEQDARSQRLLADWWLGAPPSAVSGAADPTSAQGGFNTMGFPFDPSKLGRDESTLDPNFNRSVLGSLSPSRPRFPAGVALLDAFTLDGAGRAPYRVSADDDDPAAATQQEQVVRAFERSFRLAQGFSGKATPGLINVNTAPPEVLRALPNMSSLAFNDAHPRRLSGNPLLQDEADWLRFGNNVGYADFAGQFPFGLTENMSINGPRVRVPEAIAIYREARQMSSTSIGFSLFPEYWDRGFRADDPDDATLGFFEGMRRGQGIASIGELALLRREPGQTLAPTTQGNTVVSPPEAYQRSWSMQFASRDPFLMTGTDGQPRLGWSVGDDQSAIGGPTVLDPPGALSNLDAKLSTDRLPLVLQTDFKPDGAPVSSVAYHYPDIRENTVAEADQSFGDVEEQNMLLSGIANLVTTRSDVFTVYFRVRSFTQNPTTGVWDASDGEQVIDDVRYVMLIDRSGVNRPGDQPRILYVHRVEE
jgi:hypothetical protein